MNRRKRPPRRTMTDGPGLLAGPADESPSPDFSGSSTPRSGVARCTIEPNHEHEVEDTNAFVALSNLSPPGTDPHRTHARQRRIAGRDRLQVQRWTAVNRHWHGHVSDQMKASFLAGPLQLEELAQMAAETGASVLDHLHAIRVVLFSHLTTATEAGDGALAANVAGRLTHVLETIARISGELGALATNTTYNIVNNQMVLTQHPSFLRLQASLLHALAPFPEARAAVVAALRELDGDTPPAAADAPVKLITHAPAQ
jgi:hypothetical protein